MKPEHFICEYGVDNAREVFSTGSDTYVFKPKGKKKYVQLSIADLKRLVESLDLVDQYGGIGKAKDYLKSEYRKLSSPITWSRLDSAIKDHESIYGGSYE